MTDFLEQLVVRWINHWSRPRATPASPEGVLLGHRVSAHTAGAPVRLPDALRTQHIAVLGKTGTGKSSLLRWLGANDVRRDRGWLAIDLHGDTTPFLLQTLAAEERRRRTDLSDRVVLIDPTDATWSVGLNILDAASDTERFVHIADVTALLKERWHLDSLGARTEELLRHALLVLSVNHLTLVDLPLFLTNTAFRAYCLRQVPNVDIVRYFTDRFDAASEAMQATWREAVLNKITAFTTDPHFRHLLGQARSTVSLRDALDRGCWVLLHLPKGRLGDHAATLGSLFLAMLKNALFARQRRHLATVYADELQNLVAYASGLDTLLSESRKFGVGFCSANQFLDQYPPAMRAAILSVGTQLCFQLSGPDADRLGSLLEGGKSLQELLKHLPLREAVIKSGSDRWQHLRISTVTAPAADPTDLIRRSYARWATRRHVVESSILARQRTGERTEAKDLDDWE